MADRDFFGPAAQEAARSAIREVEGQTAAEVAISVSRCAGRYREGDYLSGFLLALATLVALLFLPQSFALWSFPVDLAVSFVVGAFICSRTPLLRRFLTPARFRERQARQAAHSFFVEQRLARLPGRNAILVYVALFERAVIVVPDLGIDPQRLEPRWSQSLAALAVALAPRPDWPRFLSALRGLGPVLAGAYPRQADDVNELPDSLSTP